MSSGNARKKTEGKPSNGKVRLGERLIAVMKTIADQDGGPVSTAQLAALHYPPDVAGMLRWQGVDAPNVASLMSQYPAEYLGQRVELAKFLDRLARTEPEQLAAVDPLWQQVLRIERSEWLLKAIEKNVPLPDVFMNRIRQPSELVSSAAKVGLRRLVEAEMVIVDEMPVRRSEGSGQYLYYLTAKGRRWLAEAMGVEIKQISYRRPGQLSDLKLLHHLLCVDLAIAVHLSCRRRGYRIRKEYTDAQLKKLLGAHPVKYTMRHPDDPDMVEEMEGSTAPDYYFFIEANGKVFAHLVEVDRGSITVRNGKSGLGLRDFKRRVLILSEVYKSRVWHQLFPEAGNSYRYLVVTNAGVDARGVHDRVQSLKAAAEEALRETSASDEKAKTAGQRYLFARWSEAVKPATTDYFSSETILDGKWWFQAGEDQKRALIW